MVKEDKGQEFYRELAEKILGGFIKTRGFLKHNEHEELYSISKGEKFVLVLLSDFKEPISQKKLTECMKVAPSRLTAIIDSLEKKGYAKRKRSDKDKRVVNIAITGGGAKYFKKMRDNMLNVVAEDLRKLGEKDAKSFAKLLIKFLENS
jgi:DNA-binding MarR family transcriptional regulator